MRRATLGDLTFLAEQTEGILHSLPEFSDASTDLQHTINNLSVYLQTPTIAVFLEQDNQGLTGVIIGVVHTPFYTTRKELAEVFYWVRPDVRSTRLSLQLLDNFESWGRELGAKYAVLAAASGYKTDLVVKFYQRRGYRVSGIQCTKEL